VPSDRTIVVERFQDEIGDWRVCVLSPFGARVHAPWAAAVRSSLQESAAGEVEAIWSDDGIVFRLPESDEPPETSRFLPDPEEIEDRVVRSLGETSLFAARFRENAARALLLPRRHPGRRSPLWAQRKRSADLLAVASRYGSFPILLETYRECLRDVFDLPGLVDLLRGVASRRIRVATVDARQPSPFAASLLFSYVANFIYDGDAPLAERRAQALSVDAAQLRELLGEAELRELLDPDAIADLERSLQRLGAHRARRADDLHDLLLAIGDLTEGEIRERSERPDEVAGWLRGLSAERRAVEVSVGETRRWIAAEDAGRYRDAVGAMPPPGLPEAFLAPVEDPAADLLSRYARTHGPFRLEDAAARFGMPLATARLGLERLADRGRVLEGDFLRGGREREWCDAGVLRAIKRRSLARLRREVEPVEPAAFGRFLLEWQGVARPRAGLDALLTVVEQLQGAPIPASVLEREVLPARIERYRPADLDTLCAAGEITWRGIEPLGPSDGRIALYLTDRAALLAPPPREAPGELAARVRALLASRGALFFADLAAETGAFAGDLVAALWDLVWSGEVTNDTLAPLRSLLRGSSAAGERKRPKPRGFVSRRAGGPPGSEGRWSLVARAATQGAAATSGFSETERRAALARVLLERHGVLTREAVPAELVAGGFSAVYPVLKAMEEAGRIRRGYFVAGLGATQFAVSGADDRLRAMRETAGRAPDAGPLRFRPGQPVGSRAPWPPAAGPGRPQRAAGAQVILRDGALVAWAGRTESNLLTFLPPEEPERSAAARDLAAALAGLVETGKRRAVLVGRVDGADPARFAAGAVSRGGGLLRGLARISEARAPEAGFRFRFRLAPSASRLRCPRATRSSAPRARCTARSPDAASPRRARRCCPAPASRSRGRTVAGVAARGKNLLVHFDDGSGAAHPHADDRLVAPVPAGREVAQARLPARGSSSRRTPGSRSASPRRSSSCCSRRGGASTRRSPRSARHPRRDVRLRRGGPAPARSRRNAARRRRSWRSAPSPDREHLQVRDAVPRARRTRSRPWVRRREAPRAASRPRARSSCGPLSVRPRARRGRRCRARASRSADVGLPARGPPVPPLRHRTSACGGMGSTGGRRTGVRSARRRGCGTEALAIANMFGLSLRARRPASIRYAVAGFRNRRYSQSSRTAPTNAPTNPAGSSSL
jgi:ATP-dependent Lhr-like helicase